MKTTLNFKIPLLTLIIFYTSELFALGSPIRIFPPKKPSKPENPPITQPEEPETPNDPPAPEPPQEPPVLPPDPDSNVSSEVRQWRKILRDNGGFVMNERAYSDDPDGFHQYLRDSGVLKFSGLEIIEPHSSSAARKCGYQHLLPPQKDWIRGAALVKWMEEAALVAGELPYLRNWYRPRCYNSAVGGASKSDHIQARGIDVDFSSSAARRRAQKWLCKFWNSSLNMQIGLGGVSIHLGAMSPLGKRNWFYSSYKDSDKNRTCFD